jgi:hypothetical protein
MGKDLAGALQGFRRRFHDAETPDLRFLFSVT